MRKLEFLSLLVAIAVPTLAPQDAPLHSMLKRITVEELGQVLAAAHSEPDQEVAQQLSGLELTERLSTVRFSHWEIQSPGPKSRQALLALADVSAFLDLPAAEIPAVAAPDLRAQRRMMALTVDYATKTIHQLPNFFATRVTTSFRDEPEIYERPKMEWFPFYRPLPVTRQSPLRSVGQYSTTVLYRKGREEVRSSAAQSKSGGPQGFTTSGEFGPILGTPRAR